MIDDDELMHIETDDTTIHKLLDNLEADDWYFFRAIKSGSYWAKRNKPYSGKVSEPWTFADTPEEAIKKAHKMMCEATD
jgi:hypothetical protein